MRRSHHSSWTVLLVPVILVLASTLLQARTDYVYQSGTCANGNQWYCVTRFEDGIAVSTRGVDCSGTWYTGGCGIVLSPTDPYNGQAPSVYGHCDDGVSQWSARLTFDEEGHPATIVGRSCLGGYWIATSGPLVPETTTTGRPSNATIN